jgi:hypothetical protein
MAPPGPISCLPHADKAESRNRQNTTNRPFPIPERDGLQFMRCSLLKIDRKLAGKRIPLLLSGGKYNGPGQEILRKFEKKCKKGVANENDFP